MVGHQRMSIPLLQRASVVVLCGGNVHALLQSFRANDACFTALKQRINDDMCLLLTWSAGSNGCGSSVEHTCDRLNKLELSLNQPLCLRGLGLLPNYSFAPHRLVTEYDNFMDSFRRQRRRWYGGSGNWLVLLPNGESVVFWQSQDPVHWSSYDIGWIDMGVFEMEPVDAQEFT